jgi:hypothetical protein
MLATIIPRNRRTPYDMRKVMRAIFDVGSLFEIQPTWGKGIVTSFARLGGRPVGVVANNPMVYAGAMDARSARKQGHFVELCDTFHLPIVYLVDQPGFLVGPQAEAAGTLRDGMRAVYIGSQATVPVVTLVVRKCYGMAGMAACDKAGINFKIAWPSAEIGNLPVQGGARAAFRREIEAAPDPAAREAEIEAELIALTSPYRMAEAFAVEDIIDPRETGRTFAASSRPHIPPCPPSSARSRATACAPDRRPHGRQSPFPARSHRPRHSPSAGARVLFAPDARNSRGDPRAHRALREGHGRRRDRRAHARRRHGGNASRPRGRWPRPRDGVGLGQGGLGRGRGARQRHARARARLRRHPRAAIMHSSSVIVPAALALGESLKAPGREILAALVVGYQIAARLGRLAPGPFQDNGFQATSVLGVFAATIAAARLLKLTPEEAVNALGTAGSMASGLMAYLSDGSDVKQMHPGWSAMSGIRAARLAKAGFRGPSAVFEYKFGVFKSFARVDITGKWETADGAPWEVELMAPKPYPACLCAHAGVQAILKLRAAGKIAAARADEIANIHCDVPNWYVGLIFEPAAAKASPRTAYEARFSGPWTMARALLDGGLDVWSFSAEKLADPARARPRVASDLQGRGAAGIPGVLPGARDGNDARRHEARRVHRAQPRHAGQPDDRGGHHRQFTACAAPGLGEAGAAELSARIDSFFQDDGAARLFQALRQLEVAPR